MVPDLGRDELRSLEAGVTVEEAVGTPKKYIVLFDDSGQGKWARRVPAEVA
jgi:hypothetical protein